MLTEQLFGKKAKLTIFYPNFLMRSNLYLRKRTGYK